MKMNILHNIIIITYLKCRLFHDSRLNNGLMFDTGYFNNFCIHEHSEGMRVFGLGKLECTNIIHHLRYRLNEQHVRRNFFCV